MACFVYIHISDNGMARERVVFRPDPWKMGTQLLSQGNIFLRVTTRFKFVVLSRRPGGFSDQRCCIMGTLIGCSLSHHDQPELMVQLKARFASSSLSREPRKAALASKTIEMQARLVGHQSF